MDIPHGPRFGPMAETQRIIGGGKRERLVAEIAPTEYFLGKMGDGNMGRSWWLAGASFGPAAETKEVGRTDEEIASIRDWCLQSDSDVSPSASSHALQSPAAKRALRVASCIEWPDGRMGVRRW